MMDKRWIATMGAAVLLMPLLAACGGNTSNSGAEPADNADSGKTEPKTAAADSFGSDEKAEILIRTGISDEQFEQKYRSLLKQKFPNVTFTKAPTNIKLQDQLASSPPDLFDQGYTNLQELTNLDLALNLDPLVKKYGVDLNRFDPYVIKDVRSYSVNKSELLLIPFSVQPFVLHYNKDLFDKFGVPYPKANSTWQDLIELSKKLARTEGGVAYRGLDAGLNVNRMQKQLSLPFVDAKTGKSLVGSTQGWKTLYQTYADIYGVPGNFPEGAKHGDGRKAFLETKTLAMYPHIVMVTDTDFVQAAQSGFKLGITTYPVFKDKPGVGTGLFGGGLAVNKLSKRQDLAFKVAVYYSSDEAQKALSKMGYVTPLVSPDVRKTLFEGNPLAAGLDLNAIYGTRAADPYERTDWDQKAFDIVNASMQTFFTGKSDINSTMREVDEKIEKMVADQKAQSK